MESILQSPKSLLTRRTSRSKSIPPALVINPHPTGGVVASTSSQNNVPSSKSKGNNI